MDNRDDRYNRVGDGQEIFRKTRIDRTDVDNYELHVPFSLF